MLPVLLCSSDRCDEDGGEFVGLSQVLFDRGGFDIANLASISVQWIDSSASPSAICNLVVNSVLVRDRWASR